MNKISKLALLSFAAVGIASAANAADLIMDNPSPTADWDFYAGFNIGAAAATADHTGTVVGDSSPTGFLLGGQIGVNRKLANNLVVGGQADLDWANITGASTGFPTVTQTINWEGSLTAHLGFDAGSFTPYVLGGFAFANGTRTSSIGPSETGTHVGFTVGAGATVSVADNVSLFGEVRFNNFGSHTYTTLPSSPVVNLTSTEVRGGINWHF